MATDSVFSEKFKTPTGILTYFAFNEPRGMPGDADDRKRYSVELVFTPQMLKNPDGNYTPEVLRLFTEINGVMAKAGLKPGAATKVPFRNVSEVEGLDGAGFPEGSIFIRARSSLKPTLFGDRADLSTGKPIVVPSDKFYSGCGARAIVQAYSFNKNGGKGIALMLASVQFMQDGNRIELGSGGDGGELLVDDLPKTGAAPAATADDMLMQMMGGNG